MIHQGIKMVYFADCIGPSGDPIGAVKIGCSYGHENRLKQISSGLPFSLQLLAAVPGGFVLEKVAHIWLWDSRISGEYFRKSEELMEIVDYANRSGRAFGHIKDSGEDYIADGAVKAFMDYHGISLKDACHVLGVPASQYEKRYTKAGFRNRNLVAAAAIAAYERDQYPSWPIDAMKGLLGEVHPRAFEKVAA